MPRPKIKKKIGIVFAPKSKNVDMKLKENLKEFGL